MPLHIDIHKEFASFFSDPEVRNAAYLVSKRLAEGHTCINIKKHNDSLTELSQDDEAMEQAIDTHELLKSGLVSQGTNATQPFILDGDNLYLHRYYTYESEIVEQISDFIHAENDEFDKKKSELNTHKDYIKTLFNNHEIDCNSNDEENINWQLVAALSSLTHNFSVVTGGPGTGKTTTVAKILSVLYTINPKLRVALAAPTGKAAARMKESLNFAKSQLAINDSIKAVFDDIVAATIHRLLGSIKNSPYFRHNADNSLIYDVIIIDESSMVGVSLMAKLLSAIKKNAQVILLGDKDQLASVEAGSIFGDICMTQDHCMNAVSSDFGTWLQEFSSNEQGKIREPFIKKTPLQNPLQEHITELKRSHRFKSNQGIGQFSKSVITGELSQEEIEAPPPKTGEYVQVCDKFDAPELYTLIDIYKEYIDENDIALALKKFNRVRFLCAVRHGKHGVNAYNRLIEEYLKQKKILNPIDGFYEHLPIMVTQNDYNLNLFNGDIGLLRFDKEGKLKVWFEDAEKGIRSVNPAYLKAFSTVFAMTIHKSQGSEFDYVGMVLPNNEQATILTRELIYTGITRAKKCAIVFSSHQVLKEGVQRQVERASGITRRLLNIN